MDKVVYFRKKLLQWHSHNRRNLPWKQTSDPYKIWLSEIILQQTQVDQGLPYYEKLIDLFPTVNHLAKASEDRLMKAWQGLGYYSRARNLQYAARQILHEFNGRFPDDYEQIIRLKGVGPYSAAAIASFAFRQPHAVLDGNVFRVLSRFFNIKDAINTASGRRKFMQYANAALDKKNPGGFNQAIMDFGATVCKPKNPDCTHCVFAKQCAALHLKIVNQLPVKSKKLRVSSVWFYYLLIRNGTGVAIEKRTNGFWKGLYQFPVIESSKSLSAGSLQDLIDKKDWFKKRGYKIKSGTTLKSQRLSHRIIHASMLEVSTHSVKKLPVTWTFIPSKNLKKFAFPKILDNYLKMFLP